MYIISSFEHSSYLELAIDMLQKNGVPKENIVAVPLENNIKSQKVFDTIYHSDGQSLLDLAAVMGTIFSVLGATFGFEWKWGPIIWGLIGLAFGAILGFIIDILLTGKSRKRTPKQNPEVVLIIKCEETESASVRTILKKHMALGIGKLST